MGEDLVEGSIFCKYCSQEVVINLLSRKVHPADLVRMIGGCESGMGVKDIKVHFR